MLFVVLPLIFSIVARTLVSRRDVFYAPKDGITHRVHDLFNLSILTPDLRDLRTSKLILGNGVKVFIVSDPGIVKAGAALSVETGNWRDPPGVSGLGISALTF
jgi:hypothetical protein